jgi:hypothetical protein
MHSDKRISNSEKHFSNLESMHLMLLKGKEFLRRVLKKNDVNLKNVKGRTYS